LGGVNARISVPYPALTGALARNGRDRPPLFVRRNRRSTSPLSEGLNGPLLPIGGGRSQTVLHEQECFCGETHVLNGTVALIRIHLKTQPTADHIQVVAV